jgi:ACR3 family arsenite efflux pump ArsB
MLNGNISLSVTITSLSLLLSIGIVPFWTKYIIGTMIQAPFLLIMKYLSAIIVIPMIMAEISRRVMAKQWGESLFHRIKERCKVFSGFGLMMMIFVVFALNGKLVLREPMLILKILIPATLFLITLLVCSNLFCRIARFRYEDSIALSLGTSSKNVPIAIALAFSAYGQEVALVIGVAGPLVQLPVMLSYLRLRRSATAKLPAEPR